jgi:hypothetical protein
MNKSIKIKITLKGAGLSYEREVDEATAGQIMALCLSSQEIALPSKSTPSSLLDTKRAGSRGESAAEYLNRHAPKRNPDKILALAGFLKEAHRKESFQQGEIKSLFRDAGELIPANLNRDFKWVVSNGWIAPDPGKKGNFYITNTGMKVLQGGFPEELVKRTKGRSNSYRKKLKKNQG